MFGGPLPLATFPIMIGVHVLVGILEAVICTAVLAAVLNTRPDLLVNQDRLDLPPGYVLREVVYFPWVGSHSTSA